MKKVPRSDKLAYSVRMIGDGIPSINVNYYVEKHENAYEGMEEIYLLHPDVKFLAEEPETM